MKNKSTHNTLLRYLFPILLLCMILSSHAEVSAKLNKTNATMNVGDELQLKISGTKKTVTWTSSDKDVVYITESGTVFALSKGSATITAKVNSKNYTCQIKVANPFREKTALNNIITEDSDLGNKVVCELTNNNSYPVYLSVFMSFYNADGKFIKGVENNIYYFESGKKVALEFVPYTLDYDIHDYSTYTIEYAARDVTYQRSILKYITTEVETEIDCIYVNVTNTSKEITDYTRISIVFYENGSVVASDYAYAYVEEPGANDTIRFLYPYTMDSDEINYDTIEVYVNYSVYYPY